MSKTKESTNVSKGAALIVITEFKEIFFGYSTSDPQADIIVLSDARQVIYFSADSKGLIGLASIGPGKDSRVSPPCPQIVIRKPTNVLSVSDNAVEKFSSSIWR